MWVQTRDFTAEQLERFKVLQRQVYATLQEVADGLRPGVTERAVARRIHAACRGQGARTYFHVPVALFGERSAYPGAFGQLEALPTGRELHEGDAVILDAAPVFDGYTADCSYAVPRAGGDRAAFLEADALLSRCRALILDRARQRANMRAVAREVDALITAAGFDNCHKKHIGKVLGHRVTRSAAGWIGSRRIWGLAPLPVSYFVLSGARASRGRAELTPNWNHTRQSDCPMQPGLWAVEPHVARGAMGVKFEEMLVVTGDSADYLDDDLPHHRRWASAATA